MAAPSRNTPPQKPGGGLGSKRTELIALGIASALVAGLAVFGLRYARTSGSGEAAPGAQAGAAAAVPLTQIRGVGLNETGVLFGMAAPFSGATKETGRGYKAGIDAAFAAVNAAGGIHGRRLYLLALDDAYDPERTKVTMKELLDERKVFGILGNAGTPTVAAAIPMALDKKVLFFAPYTGSAVSRKSPPDRYVFNFRPSYSEETSAAVRYLIQVRRFTPEQIAVFAQEDTFGEAGFAGVAAALAPLHYPESQILRVGYQRSTGEVDEAVSRLQKEGSRIKAVVMVATYKPAVRLIDKLRNSGHDFVFTNVSAVNAGQLAEELLPIGDKVLHDVVVTQVVPMPSSHATAVIKYREALAQYASSEVADFTSLEGFLAANLLVEGLRRAGRELTTDKLVDALETMQSLDLGIGTPLGYSKADHQASHKVWGTMLGAGGKYKQIEMD